MKGFVLVALAGVGTMAAAQDIPMGLGINGGFFAPSDKTLRDALGEGWFSWGITPGVIKHQNGLKIDYDFAVTNRSRNGSHATLLRPTIGATLSLGVGDIAPYVAARAGAAYVDYGINLAGGRISGKRVTPSTNFEVGILFSGKLGISARYDWIAAVDGIGYSGFSLQATYQVLKF